MDKKINTLRERFFLFMMLVVSLLLFLGSLQIFLKKPQADSAGTFPLLTSGVMILTSIVALFQSRHPTDVAGPPMADDAGSEKQKKGNRLIAALKEELPPNALIMGLGTVAYGILISVIGFYAATAAFLIGMIVYMRKGDIKTALLVTAISLVCIYLIIQLIFRIPLP